jgi:hypothetical protein
MHRDAVYKTGVDIVACDEAHCLKNRESQITQSVAALPATRRLLLSGTPVQVSALGRHQGVQLQEVFWIACPLACFFRCCDIARPEKCVRTASSSLPVPLRT